MEGTPVEGEVIGVLEGRKPRLVVNTDGAAEVEEAIVVASFEDMIAVVCTG
jgi:hypothetical protein